MCPRFLARLSVGKAIDIVDSGDIGLRDELSVAEALRALPGVRVLSGGFAEDRMTYSGAVSHVNVTRGVRDGNPYRNTAVQGSISYRLTPTVSLTGRLWAGQDYLSVTESPAFPAEVLANFPATGAVPAIALPTDQLERYEAGLTFDSRGGDVRARADGRGFAAGRVVP
jgi:hypothetical protein